MDPTSKKIMTRDEAVNSVKALRASRPLKVGYTSGVFDLLHPGHVRYLEDAKSRCDLLVVGVNSDSSVRSNKGAGRPIVPEQDRAEVVAGLVCVDLVFIFSDTNNNRNIELLKPDLYIKAGDYDRSKLSSAPLVESYGGQAVVVPFAGGYSTTSIIDRIEDLQGNSASAIELPAPQKQPAVFVDRDGTLNEHVEYLHQPEKFKLIPGALEALKLLKDGGYRIVVITNQPGIGMGYFTREEFFKINRLFLNAAHKLGLMIDKVYFCPHSVAENCHCRKPKTAMIERAVKELNLDLSRSYVVGDTTLDL
ncbi:MAG: hypothetical protein DCC75_05045, partial [Proteobacteria bacterium]